jgi:methylenetetrahydrofolate dehydrogenase (NADP+)/methenyltetrahydrofolate cyclohydrolase
MTATFIDGTKIAEEIKAEAAVEVNALRERGIRPGLSVILVGDDAASSAYVNMKARTCEKLGINSRKVTLPGSIQTAELKAEVRKLNEDDSIDGILIQLPLPKHVNKHAILESVDPRGRRRVHSAN